MTPRQKLTKPPQKNRENGKIEKGFVKRLKKFFNNRNLLGGKSHYP